MSKVTRPCSSRQRAIPHFALLLLGDCDTTEVALDARSGDERYAPCLGSWLVIVHLAKVGISIHAPLDPLPDRLWPASNDYFGSPKDSPSFDPPDGSRRRPGVFSGHRNDEKVGVQRDEDRRPNFARRRRRPQAPSPRDNGIFLGIPGHTLEDTHLLIDALRAEHRLLAVSSDNIGLARRRFIAARLPPDRKPIRFRPGKILKDLEARGGTLTVRDVAGENEQEEEDEEGEEGAGELHRWLTHPQEIGRASCRERV